MPQHPPVSWRRGSLALLFVLTLGGLALLPVVTLWHGLPGEAAGALSWRLLLQDPLIQASTLGSVAVALLAAGLASVIALPIAFAAARSSTGLRAVLIVFGLLPLAMPPFLLAAVLKAMLADHPLVGTALASQGHLALLVITYGLHYAPLVLLGMTAGLDRLDPAQAESARSHGVSDLAAWYRITLPLVTPPFVLAVSVVMLRTLGDAGAPLTLGAEGLLAPLVLAEAVGDGLSPRGIQAALLLISVNALLVVTAWRQLLAQPAPTRDLSNARRRGRFGAPVLMALTGVPALIPLVWLALQVKWPAAAATVLPGLYALGSASLPLLVATALALTCIGLPAALLARPAAASAHLVRAATAVLFVFPGLVLALAYQAAADAWPFASLLPTGWPIIAAALAITLPIVPLIPHLSAHLALRPSREAANLARCFGAAPGWLTLRLTLPGLVVLAASLAFFGAALSLLDATPIALLNRLDNLPVAGAVLQQASGNAPLATWALTGLCLVLAASCLLAGGGLLLHSRSGTKGTVHDAMQQASA